MAYHPVTYGTLLDEIVRRATGDSIARHVRTLIAEPLDVDMWMGLPEALTPRVVPGQWEQASPMEPDDTQLHEPGSYAALRQEFLQENPPMDPDFTHPAEVAAHYASERPAIGGITNARALATMYAALLGPVNGVRLIQDHTLRRVTQPRTDNVESLVQRVALQAPTSASAWATNWPLPACRASRRHSFGHTGAGGRLGIADPEHEIGFGYITSLMRNIGPHGDPRWKTLIDAVRGCI